MPMVRASKKGKDMFRTEDYKRRKVSVETPGIIYDEHNNNFYQAYKGEEYGDEGVTRPPNNKTPNSYINDKDEYVPKDPIYVPDTNNSLLQPSEDEIQEDPSDDLEEYEKMHKMRDEYLDEYLNREGFSYDINADELYKTFRQQALAKAEASRRDATARAAGLTGGYGSTYAGAVGNAAFDSAMESVDEIIPELYDAAYSKYQQEGEDILSKASLAGQMGDNLYSEKQAKIKAENQAKEDQKAAEDEAYKAATDPEGRNANIIANLKAHTTVDQQLNYLLKLVNADYISVDEATALLDRYKMSTIALPASD